MSHIHAEMLSHRIQNQHFVLLRRLVVNRNLGESLHKKRQYLEKELVDIGFRVLPAQGTYFLVADFR